MRFRCANCSQVTESESLAPSCGKCRGAVTIEDTEHQPIDRRELEDLTPGVWRYRALMEGLPAEDIVTLGEGGTPLLRAERLGEELGLRHLLVKDESRNPTGSFMDRGTTVLVSVAKGRDVRECSCDTTGNLGASLAAYCAKASIRANIHVSSNTDQGKLYQMLAYGAELETSRRPAERTLEVTAANPFLLEGEKTTGFEIVQDLDWEEPDVVVVPVGTGGHLSMIWKSIGALRGAGLARDRPCRIVGVELGEPASQSLKRRTASSADFPLAELADSRPFYRKSAAHAVDESSGFFLKTTPEESIAATSLLAKSEGIFAEPSSASVVAALSRAVGDGLVGSSETVVCVVTGAGLKDPRSVSRIAREARRVGRRSFTSPSVKIGETKLAILRLLRNDSDYAYGLWRILRTQREISTASIYQHLLELEEFTMIRKRGSVVAGGRERVLYELTRKGAQYLKITEKLEESQNRI